MINIEVIATNDSRYTTLTALVYIDMVTNIELMNEIILINFGPPYTI